MNRNSKDLEYAARLVHSFHPPPSIDSMVEAFREHCEDGGADFLEHLKPWHISDALAEINDSVQNYRPELAMRRIKEILNELFEIAAQGHREKLKWDGVE